MNPQADQPENSDTWRIFIETDAGELVFTTKLPYQRNRISLTEINQLTQHLSILAPAKVWVAEVINKNGRLYVEWSANESKSVYHFSKPA